jgi:DNA-binding HxlR family transcriptional regulator
MYEQLNPILHSQLRLAIISLLVKEGKQDFSNLKDQLNATAGNLSVQMKKLEEAEYIKVKKSFKNNYPHTECFITETGLNAFEEYVNQLKNYLNI